jgi:hypothetical protein
MNIANQKDISVKWNILFIMLFLTAFIAKAQISETVFIEKVQTYQDSVKIKWGRDLFEDALDPATFNIKDYMKMFNALKLKDPIHEYGCFYFDNFLDGKPYIYTGNHDFDIMEHVRAGAGKIEMEDEERERFIRSELYRFLNDSVNRACNNVIPEDCVEGYLQYLFFREFGEQFALKWHAANKKKRIIYTRKDIEKIMDEYGTNQISPCDSAEAETPLFECDPVELNELLTVNPVPVICLDADNCLISLYEIEPHNGIYRRTYSIGRFYSYNIILKDEKKLVDITSNFIF